MPENKGQCHPYNLQCYKKKCIIIFLIEVLIKCENVANSVADV